MTKTPPYLKKGDKIALVSTARKINLEELDTAIQVLDDWKLELVPGRTLGAEYYQFAGADVLRVEDFQAMLDDPEVKAILCARGGYGTVRIIDQLDFTKFVQQPKWIVGYSDVTVLHSHIHQNLGIETMHASMPINFKDNSQEALASLKMALFGEEVSYQIGTHTLNRHGEAKGALVGGNLSILYSISNSVSDIDTDGKILFLEDLDEYLYHIDRMMMQLKRSGKLNKLAGLVVGGMTKMNDNTISYGFTAKEIIAEHLAAYDYPVAFDFPAGHVDDNRALIMGREVTLQVNDENTILKF